MLIPNYPNGSDITIMNVIYHYGMKISETKRSEDILYIIYKDNKTGMKHLFPIMSPKYTFYKLPDELQTNYNHFFYNKNDLIPITCKYNELNKVIAEQIGMKHEFYENIKNGNPKANKFLHADSRIFSSDIEITDYYRMKFGRDYTNRITKITKLYIDIEVDIKYMVGDFPEPGECPINALSILNEENHTLYTFLLRDSRNKKIEEFENYLKDNTEQFDIDFMNLLADTVGGWKNVNRFNLEYLQVKQIFYDDELELITEAFKAINILKPDFVLAWNMAFDIPYIIERIKMLGEIPEHIMCHPDFPQKYCKYNIDEMHSSEPEQRGDYADISSYSVYLDQLIQFASRRKGQSAYSSMKLDDIGNEVAGVRKLDYHNITSNIGDLPYMDYRVFVMYNMMDVIVQYCIENKTGDIDYIVNKSLINATSYRKIHRQTIYLANRMRIFLYSKGLIAGNNVNKFKDKPKDKYDGAFVADPKLVSDKPKIKLRGNPIMVFKNANDFDYKALYPSITREFNMAPNTQKGMINIPEQVYAEENLTENPKYCRQGAYIENLASHNYLEFCRRWLHLGTFEEVYDDIIEYFTNIKTPFYDLYSEFIDKNHIELVTRIKNKNIQLVTRIDKNFSIVERYKPIKEKFSNILGGKKL